ncbi:MAG: hypothetical protein WC965_01175 [Thiohalomonadaceae bacterium]
MDYDTWKTMTPDEYEDFRYPRRSYRRALDDYYVDDEYERRREEEEEENECC